MGPRNGPGEAMKLIIFGAAFVSACLLLNRLVILATGGDFAGNILSGLSGTAIYTLLRDAEKHMR